MNATTSQVADRVTPVVKAALRRRYGMLSPVFLLLLTVLWQVVKFVIDAELATTTGATSVDLMRAGVESEIAEAVSSGEIRLGPA